jgi:hypothetical protein
MAPRIREPWSRSRAYAGIDPGDEGLDGVIQELSAEAAGDELGDGFLALAPGDEGLAEQTQLGGEGEEARRDHRRGRGRQGAQAAATHDEAFLGGAAGGYQAIRQADVPDQTAEGVVLAFGLLQGGIGAVLDEVAVAVFAGDDAADPRGALEHLHGVSLLVQEPGRREAGNTGADDNDHDAFRWSADNEAL